jgi:predicted CXXCH cytochrome family protein
MFCSSRSTRSTRLGHTFKLLVAAAFCFVGLSDTAIAQTVADRDKVCASCHREIYEQYLKTPMARASGAAIDGLIPADFQHKLSGIRYSIHDNDGKVYLTYDRPAGATGGELHGGEELRYFLGSGTRGRTFLFERENYWFEIPINWYAKKGLWDMAPNYQRATEMPLTLPVDSTCLHCHASDVLPELPDARNHYSSVPFKTGGITCEACHGDTAQHVASKGHRAVLNPDKLAANLRDSICLQCHLEAEITVNRVGHTLYDFRPGQEISDYVVHFVHQDSMGAGGRATSQWEALLQSACKRASGDRLTCTTCHDPHNSPSADKAVAFYRTKCLSCHTDPKFATSHHPEQPDCVSCHMPRSATQDIAHEQVTDHRIQLPSTTTPQTTGGRKLQGDLIAVRGTASERDTGIAYSQFALRGNRQAGERALQLLRKSEQNLTPAATAPPDADLHTQLGFLEQLNGDGAAAAKEYRLAIAANPLATTALGNIALLEAKAGKPQDAIKLWSTVLDHDPTQATAALNLAMTYCYLNDSKNALMTLDRLLAFSPDNQQARTLALALRQGNRPCMQHQ